MQRHLKLPQTGDSMANSLILTQLSAMTLIESNTFQRVRAALVCPKPPFFRRSKEQYSATEKGQYDQELVKQVSKN